MNIAFPHLPDRREGQRPYIVAESDRQLFIDSVLLPALGRVLPIHKRNNFGLGYSTDGYRFRLPDGKLAFRGTFLDPEYFDPLVEHMRAIVDADPDDPLSEFRDFFFVTTGVGLKVTFEGLIPIERRFQDLRWEVFDSENVFIDVGFDIAPAADDPFSVGVWRTSSPFFSRSGLPFEDLISTFWGGPLHRMNLREDMFAGFFSLGGFDYHSVHSSPRSESGIYGLVKLVAYSKVKQPFFFRRSGTHRMGKDFSASAIWRNDEGYAALMVCYLYFQCTASLLPI